MSTRTKSKRTKSSPAERWKKALGNGELINAYNDFTVELLKRHRDGKTGDAFFGESEGPEEGPKIDSIQDKNTPRLSNNFDLLAKVAVEERKVYSKYAGKEIADYDELVESGKHHEINKLIEETISRENPLTYTTVEYAKSIVDDTYKSEKNEDVDLTKLNSLDQKLPNILKENGVPGDHERITNQARGLVEKQLTSAGKELFTANLEDINYDRIVKSAQKDLKFFQKRGTIEEKKSASFEVIMGTQLANRLIAKSRHPKSPEGLQQVFSSYQESHRDHLIETLGTSSQNQEQSRKSSKNSNSKHKRNGPKISLGNALTAFTATAIAADIGVKLLEPAEKKAERLAKEKASGKKKLTFGRVVSIAASVGLFTLASLWAYRAMGGQGLGNNRDR